MSIADRDAILWNPGPVIKCAYWNDISKFPLCPDEQYKSPPELFESFRDKVLEAQGKKPATQDIHLIFGRLGEEFAAVMFGMTLHKNPTAEGSDGKLGNEFVEVKTITPAKSRDFVRLKRAGNFGKVAVVKVTRDFQFGARMVDREVLKKYPGTRVKLYWDEMIVGCGAKALEMHRNFPIVQTVATNA